jgi:hypothetical protein
MLCCHTRIDRTSHQSPNCGCRCSDARDDWDQVSRHRCCFNPTSIESKSLHNTSCFATSCQCQPIRCAHASIIIAGTIILVALTFASTILFTDLKNVNIARPMQTKLLPIGLGPNSTLSANGVLHYRSSPSANWRFGEMKPDKATSTAEIADTGNTHRALLPYMKEESRATLEH